MTLSILEIGYGSSPASAVMTGGEVFADPATTYFGVDLPSDRRRIMRAEHQDQVNAVEAHWAALPYRSEAFDAVVMRSCFGQFRDTPLVWHSERWSLDFALHEVSRVLKPEGELFISEENTPEDVSRVIVDIARAGLDVEKFEIESLHNTGEINPSYAALRSRYFGDESRGIGGGNFFNRRYVLSATKPADRTFIITNTKARSLLPYKTDHSGEWHLVSDDEIELGYYMPEDSGTPEGELRVAKKLVELLGDRYNFWVEQAEAALLK